MFDWCAGSEEEPAHVAQGGTRQLNEKAMFDWCAGSEEELILAV